VLYVGDVYLTWTLPTIYNVGTTSGGFSFALLLLQALLIPTRGLWNFGMYLRPTFMRCRKKYNYLTRMQVFGMLIRGKEEQDMKQEHKKNLKKQRRHHLALEKKMARGGHYRNQQEEKSCRSYWARLRRAIPSSSLDRGQNFRSNSSVDPSVSLAGGSRGAFSSVVSGGASEQSTNALSRGNRQREKLIKSWQRNYNNYPGRHRHGCRSNGEVQADIATLDSEEEQELWQQAQPHAEAQAPEEQRQDAPSTTATAIHASFAARCKRRVLFCELLSQWRRASLKKFPLSKTKQTGR
jgi:hypothetical protein